MVDSIGGFGINSAATANAAGPAPRAQQRPVSAQTDPQTSSSRPGTRLGDDNQLAALRSELSALNSDNANDLNLDPQSGDRGLDGIVDSPATGPADETAGGAPGSLVDISV